MCGLAGIISPEQTTFNINHFNILGTLNDERGGDSCGIFVDGLIDYGVDAHACFRYFTEEINYPKTASIALLHCRKASPGYPINLAQAQPVIIYNKDKVDFVLMHNGTINNIKSLAAKYLPNFKIDGLSDSQILAYIIYNKGYDVLEEYAGCAVLIMVDYRQKEPIVLLFKGSSCYNESKSKFERPLYYMYNDGKFYFSSMYCSLRCINHQKDIFDFPVNELCRLQNNKLFCIRKVNRSTLKKPVVNCGANYGTGYLYNNIYYNKDVQLYMLNNAIAHGVYTVYPSGYLVDSKYINLASTTTCRLAFFNGKLLYNEDCYNFLEAICDLFSDDILTVHCPEVVDYFCYSPQCIGGQFKQINENFEYVDCTDREFVILFTDGSQVSIKDNIVTNYYIYPTISIERFQNATKNVYFNFEALEKQILALISKKLVNLDEV